MCELLVDRYDISQEETEFYQTLDHRSNPNNFRLRHCLLIEHENKTFKVIDWDDRDNPGKYDAREIVKSPLCQFVLKCQYSRMRILHPKVRPFFYFDKTDPDVLSQNIPAYRQTPRTETKLYWRGNNHLGRQKVFDLLSDLLSPNYNELAERDVYFQEMSQHVMAISLPGLGRSCHRDFEAFAVGTVVLMPTFHNQFAEPLVADEHYVAAEIGCDLQKHPQQAADRLRERYLQVKDNHDFLQFVRGNAEAYYDQFIRYDASAKMMIRLLELD